MRREARATRLKSDPGRAWPSRLRAFAATLVTLTGTAMITALWFRNLTEVALLDAVLGAIYLVIGIGLFGQSRFTLFLAIIVPALDATWLLHRSATAGMDGIQAARLTADGLVVLSAAPVLLSRGGTHSRLRNLEQTGKR